MTTVGEDFPQQVRRVQQLREEYLKIGYKGELGAAFLQQTLNRAADAQSSGDVVRILRVYEELTLCK